MLYKLDITRYNISRLTSCITKNNNMTFLHKNRTRYNYLNYTLITHTAHQFTAYSKHPVAYVTINRTQSTAATLFHLV